MKNLNFKYQPFHKVFRHFFVGIFLIMAPVFAQAQNKTITGVVSDEHKMPLPGVTVSVKGTKAVTMTDFNGQFKISADSKDQLVFTYVSFETATITVGDRSTINVGLRSATSNLDEIVVIGYGSVKRKDLTGSVASVSMADINKAPVRSFDDALAGRVAGVQVTSADGRPGSGVDIVIRGNNSVTQANGPLYVIDGFLIEDPNNNVINPAEIASIDVLKDASATAIYGARGANGVIVIQTKKGKQGKPVFTFNSSTAIQNMANKMDVMSPYDYVKYQLEYNPVLASTPGNPKTPTELYLTGPRRTLDFYKNVTPIDWQRESTQTALFISNDFAVRGGTKKLKYSLSASYTDQTGILINSEYLRYQGRAVLDYDITSKLKVGINTNYSYLQPKGIDPSRGYNGGLTNLMASIWGYKPVPDPVVDITEEFSDPNLGAFDYRVNPKLATQNAYDKTTTNSLNFNSYLEYLLAKGLRLRSTYGIVENKTEHGVFYNSMTAQGRGGNGENGKLEQSNSSSWLNENTLTWDKNFGKSKLIVLGGATFQGGKSWYHGYTATQVPAGLGIKGLDQGVQLMLIPSESNWTMASFLTRLNYSYDSRYSLTASFRADGSSKFPSENHWGYFPSGAVAWTFKNEKFLKNNKTLSEGKLRSSFGQTGNNRVGNFDYLTTISYPIGSNYVFDNQYVVGYVPTKLGNSNLKWETTEQIDAGIDLGFFNQRITFVGDVYRKRTYDLLLNSQLPLSSGFNSALKNVGSVENKGLELTLTTKNIVTKDFTWTTSGNIAFNENKLLALDEGQTYIQSGIPWDSGVGGIPAYISKVGGALGNMYGFEYLGSYKYSDFIPTVNASGAPVYGNANLKPGVTTNGDPNVHPGSVKYKDQNGDGKLDNNDYVVLGNGLPKHTGGLSNNFTYKGFDLNIFFQWQYGNKLQNINRSGFDGPGAGSGKNQFASYNDYWSPNNPNSNTPGLGGWAGGVAAGYSNYTLEDGSYLRLKTLALGYNVDSKMVAKWHLKSLRFYVSAQNLHTWTKYTGPDPEVNTYRSVLTPGFDYSAYPRARTFALGTNISF